MNPIIVKIKNILETYLAHVQKSADECKKINEQYREDVAISMRETIKESLHSVYEEDKEKINTLVDSAIEAIKASDLLKGEEITPDAQLLSEERFGILSQAQFAYLVKRYERKNNTMCTLLRKYDQDHIDQAFTADDETKAALATAGERIEAWQKVGNGALSVLEAVYAEGRTFAGMATLQQRKHIVYDIDARVANFMQGDLSRPLHMLIGD